MEPIVDVNELKGLFSTMKTVLGALDDARGKVSSISHVPDQLRKVREEAYVPKVVSIGPLHRGKRELLYMEEIKWRCMLFLLLRTTKEPEVIFDKCGKAIFQLDALIRATYANDIKLNSSELTKIMLIDGCFLLELLISNDDGLYEKLINQKEIKESPRTEVGNMEQILSDLKLLENQIPVFILAVLFQNLFPTMANNYQGFQKIVNDSALFLFGCSSASSKSTLENRSTPEVGRPKAEETYASSSKSTPENKSTPEVGSTKAKETYASSSKSSPENKSTPEVGSTMAKETDGCVHFLDLIHMFMTGKEENNDQRSINSNGSGSTESRPEEKSRPENDRPKAEETDDHQYSININGSGSTELKQTLLLKHPSGSGSTESRLEDKSRPEDDDSPNGSGSIESKQALQLKCCAARLEAAGVEIVALEKRGSMSRLENTNFHIEDSENKKLEIQQLHITKTEEVQWWNLIAWEQNRTIRKKFLKGSENGTRCRFSQYALLFKDLVCCEHDIQLLIDRRVLKVDNGEKRSNEDLMTFFQEMAKGIDVDLGRDESYRQLLEGLNKCSGTKWNRKILSHHRESFKAKTRYMCRDLLEILKREYTPNMWKTLGVIAAIILLVLTVAQTILAAISL